VAEHRPGNPRSTRLPFDRRAPGDERGSRDPRGRNANAVAPAMGRHGAIRPGHSSSEDAVNFEGFAEMGVAELVRDAHRRRRFLLGDTPHKGAVRSPEDVLAEWPEFPGADRDVFGGLLLNAHHETTRRVVVSVGSLNASIVHPREVFRPALLYSAASIVLVRDHPRGPQARLRCS